MDAPRRARRADSFADPLVRPPPPASAPIWSDFLRPAKPTANGVPAAAEAPAAVPSAHHHPDRAPGGAREAGVEAKRASGHGDAGTRRDIDHPRRLAVDALRRRRNDALRARAPAGARRPSRSPSRRARESFDLRPG